MHEIYHRIITFINISEATASTLRKSQNSQNNGKIPIKTLVLWIAEDLTAKLKFFLLQLSDTEKLSSSLAVLAEIFEEVAEISREGYRCYMIILVEYKLK